ncbi:YlaI family protein [Virgibacillus sp. NKC19-3]|uniref:YlaI family protein n=1 Tax=Virgibacillus saliphilus TaxID=2831674 RepID=UPI001C9B547D|nr:YlaI family protein [Virgibacillus sp. NKC19-3]MBY7143764.1 YlaI family protein [Virgibacillus sp. NKC19-3]
MQVKCVICDTIETLEDHSPEAKRLRNRRVHMYLCETCYERIGYKTIQRHSTGNFHLYRKKKQKRDLI